MPDLQSDYSDQLSSHKESNEPMILHSRYMQPVLTVQGKAREESNEQFLRRVPTIAKLRIRSAHLEILKFPIGDAH